MAATIQEVLRDHRIEFAESGQHHHTREGWINLKNCPYCGSQNYHLGFNLQSRYFSCWRCGSHYAPQVFDKLGINQRDTADLFPHFHSSDKEPAKHYKLIEPKGILPLSKCKQHRAYLMDRGLVPITIASLWHVQGIKLEAHLRWRLYIPVFHKGEKVSWTTRAIGKKVERRYVSAPKDHESMNIKRVVYGADLCSHTIVVCEGPADAWAIGPGGAALFGTAFTPAQVKRISEFPYRFVCFDSTPDAQSKAKALCRLLSVFPGTTQNIMLDAKDPAESTAAELSKLRRVTKLR